MRKKQDVLRVEHHAEGQFFYHNDWKMALYDVKQVV